jgi:hypothetical protein
MTAPFLPSSNTPVSPRVSSPHREGKPEATSINATATAYLVELARRGGIKLSDITVQHVTTKSKEIKPSEGTQSAAEFLEVVKRELASPEPQPENIRHEIEEGKVILSLGRTRYFNGFLRSRVVFGFDTNLALQMSAGEAEKLQPVLLLLGYDTQRRPSLQVKASF